ncbi:hypothetical protein NB593_03160 [Vibrio antiquarius]|nr:hypothetical protein [Vibrio antiquarius]MCR9911864.1 hypothetical protein [Vibrio antiquarius]
MIKVACGEVGVALLTP